MHDAESHALFPSWNHAIRGGASPSALHLSLAVSCLRTTTSTVCSVMRAARPPPNPACLDTAGAEQGGVVVSMVFVEMKVSGAARSSACCRHCYDHTGEYDDGGDDRLRAISGGTVLTRVFEGFECGSSVGNIEKADLRELERRLRMGDVRALLRIFFYVRIDCSLTFHLFTSSRKPLSNIFASQFVVTRATLVANNFEVGST
ncbi:hypothetical protein MTO96_015843 [Rhipicephalus appendiculatus]